jgi:predicted RNase H-like nuclease (RuvC/YqgF family)
MQQENRGLKRQVEETAEKCEQLEQQLNDMKLERDVAFKAYLKVSESINSLKTDATSKDRRIEELEQANLIQQQTINQLNQQLAQLLAELNNAGVGGTNVIVDPNFQVQATPQSQTQPQQENI